MDRGGRSNQWVGCREVREPRIIFSYVSACYFIVLTFAKIGYGDIIPENKTEILFTYIFNFFGVTFFSLLAGKFQGIYRASKQQGAYLQKEESLDELIIHLERHCKTKIPGVIINKIRSHWRRHERLNLEQVFEGNAFFKKLPQAIKDDVIPSLISSSC